MIIKSADDKSSAILKLESLLAHADNRQSTLIENELRMLRAGIKGEQDSAYHIDFDFRDSPYTAVIHDLRLEHNGRVAQIDHLIIHRAHKFYVLETKSFSHGLKITDEGEFLRWNDWKRTFEGMPSPIEQNRRHVEVLRDVLTSLGYQKADVESFVLVSPAARIDRSKSHPSPEVVKADQFSTAFAKRYVDSVSSVTGALKGLGKMFFGDSHETIAQKLVALHRPITSNYEGKFGIQSVSASGLTGRQGAEAIVDASPAISTLASADSSAAVAPPPTPAFAVAPAVAEDKAACKSCQSAQLAIEYGKYGYYFKCLQCSANTALKIGCGIAGHKEKIRKSKLSFFRECEQCGTSTLFHVNQT